MLYSVIHFVVSISSLLYPLHPSISQLSAFPRVTSYISMAASVKLFQCPNFRVNITLSLPCVVQVPASQSFFS
ncbi:hypothetical protein BJV82DRAFT_598458, partial [Fennellomyces sp. T-0311]